MKYEILHLKDFFPALGENGCDAALTAYLPDNLTEMGRDDETRPCLLICPAEPMDSAASGRQSPLHCIFSRTASTYLC